MQTATTAPGTAGTRRYHVVFRSSTIRAMMDAADAIPDILSHAVMPVSHCALPQIDAHWREPIEPT
jgi:hypothetical protein